MNFEIGKELFVFVAAVDKEESFLTCSSLRLALDDWIFYESDMNATFHSHHGQSAPMTTTMNLILNKPKPWSSSFRNAITIFTYIEYVRTFPPAPSRLASSSFALHRRFSYWRMHVLGVLDDKTFDNIKCKNVGRHFHVHPHLLSLS